MRARSRWLAAVLVALPLGVAVAQAPAGDPAAAAALERARAAADAVVSRVRGLLEAELARGGPAGAVDACAETAQVATQEESERLGVRVRRVSLRFRNPADAPDDYERAALLRLEETVRGGELPSEVSEFVPVTGGGQELRYLRPVVVAPHCLGCHGRPEELKPGVAEALARRFPDDPATGYSVGDLRGAVSVTVAVPAQEGPGGTPPAP